MKPVAKVLRCAVYTRVSTEHGLDQEFNSLDNQREAAEAYIKSQAGEGWRCLPVRFDDGGFSGGSMERPALQQLMAAIALRQIDVVVVYKVDRLTRSLADFAKLVELFDGHGVSFVSVTQAFNTTTSMGRLTLNVLLSFAQFEREVTGERIRDKIAASKKKGIWMGARVPLGYRAENRALHIVPEHAAIIRRIYERYLALGSATALSRDLDATGFVVPVRVDGAGRSTGGGHFSRGHLYAILKNPIYAGRIAHRDQSHDGQHPAVVDLATFAAVQDRLAAATVHDGVQACADEHLLTGRIRDDRGHTMSPSHARKGSRRYRYYVSRAVLEGKSEPGSVPRVSGSEIEARVVSALRAAIADTASQTDAALIGAALTHVTVSADHLSLDLIDRDPIVLPWSAPSKARRREVITPSGLRPDPRPMRTEDRARILRAIATGRRWMKDLVSGRTGGTDAIATREQVSERSVRMTLSLAHLAPRVVAAIVAGRLPRGIGVARLADLPSSWAEQEATLGL